MNNSIKNKICRLTFRLLKFISNDLYSSSVSGDCEEMYEYVLSSRGKTAAYFWLWKQVLKSLPEFLINFVEWRFIMLKNYLKVAFRNLKKQKGYSFINIAGLASGLACCILMFMWVYDELSYDRFHLKSENIYRIITETLTGDNKTVVPLAPYPIGDALVRDYPGIVRSTKYTGGFTGWQLRYGNQSLTNERIAFADPAFFEMFTFPFIKGDHVSALENRYSIVLTESLAKKIFCDIDPVGETVQLIGRNMMVTGVIKDVPFNSHMQFDFIVPYVNQRQWREQDLDSWEQNGTTYIQLSRSSSEKETEEKISGVIKKYHSESNSTVHLQPLKDIHLFSDFSFDTENINSGDITYVYVFSITAFMILIVACINFMNLSTARSSKRAVEVGMRKVVGAKRKDLVKQFFSESVLLTVLSLFIALILVYLFLPTFNSLSGKHFTLDLSDKFNLLTGLFLIIILTGFFAGSYPALFLSAFQPANVLKTSGFAASKGRSLMRKSLVVFQFTVAVTLIICTVIIYSQLMFVKNKPLGFDKDNMIYFPGYGRYGNDYEFARNELLRNPHIINVTKAFPPHRVTMGITDFHWEGKKADEKVMLYPGIVSFDYIETFNMEIVDGRSFSREFSTDSLNCILNETAVKVMGLKSPVGKTIKYDGNQGYLYGFDNREGKIIGIVKDFHNNSLHKKIAPMVLKFSDRGFFICAKIDKNNISETISYLEKKWKEYLPDRPFRYNFLDNSVDEFYKNDYKTSKIIRYFTILTVLIACLGLFGMAAYMTEQRTKEIGIRKILGAPFSGIIRLVSGEHIALILISNVLAWPFSWYFMNRWLQNFEFRISMGIWLFLTAGFLSVLISIIAVSYQTVKAAKRNPVDSLRYE